ncbi:hypothetical protein EVAR_54729_1 [Eumeta japonica]|uniref:Uncharacterized protein n=1 Tax=Eumeta variegata TaxID=151549 RepID=A0A4C2AAV4_EUMVA|nr:hypothetical protein EVAR_54729_1 [Eumeta japonica]
MEAEQEKKNEIDHMMAYNRDLMKQKIDKVEQNKREHYEENVKDKKMMEDVMNKIVEEDLESMKHKFETKEKMRCEMLENQEQRKMLKEEEKLMATRENLRLREEGREMIDRDAIASMKHKLETNEKMRCEMLENQEQRKMLKEEEKLMATRENLRLREEDREMIDWDAIAFAQRAEKFEEKERSNERIMGAIQEKKDAQRRGDLVEFLQQQERVEKNKQDEISWNEKVEQTKCEMKDILMWQIQYKADVAAAERVRDAEFVHMAQQQMLKDDEEEGDKELKKKDEQKKYAQALKEQILDNESRRKKDREERN